MYMHDRKNISQQPAVWAAWQAAANDKQMTLSEWIAWCCNRMLPKQVRDNLPPRRGVGRPSETQDTSQL